MLRITRAQREKVGEPAFVGRLVQHFQLHHLDLIYHLPEPLLRERLRIGLAAGRSYGLTWEYSLTVFVAHMFRIHPEFHLQPAIHRVLDDAEIEPDERISALPARVSNRDWEEAARRDDPEDYWRANGAPAPDSRG
jgi:hypothetical protein